MGVYPDQDRLKQWFVRTPLESPLKWLRMTAQLPWRLRHPELHDIYLEGVRIENFLKDALAPDSNCIDVGAHLGAVLSAIVRRAPLGSHYAFEPVARKAEWLQTKFPEVNVRASAACDQNGPSDFYEPVSESATSTLHSAENAVRTRVMCERLDDVIPEDYWVDLLKIDVIGAEVDVLKGAARLIERCQPNLIIASGFEIFDGARTTPDALFDELSALGYGVFLVRNAFGVRNSLTKGEFLAAQRYPYQAFTFVARPTARISHVRPLSPQVTEADSAAC